MDATMSNDVQGGDHEDALSAKEVETTGASDQPFRFKDLPAEVRNYIYELSLYHEANEGFIAPVSDLTRAPNSGYCFIVKDGRPMAKTAAFHARIRGRETHVALLPTADTARTHSISKEEYDAQKKVAEESGDALCEVLKVYNERGTMISNELYCECVSNERDRRFCVAAHVCRKSCLCQPAITRVSRQLRKESLPVFYDVNAFDIQAEKWGDDGMKLARQWCVATGDLNLRMIKRFSFAVWENRRYPLPVRYAMEIEKAGVTTTLTTAVRRQGKHPWDCDPMAEDLQTYVSNAEPEPRQRTESLDRMLAYAGQVEEEGGLFVQALEKILDGFEWHKRKIRDHR